MLFVIGLAVLVAVCVYVGFRFGIPAGGPQHSLGTEISFKDDSETDGFKSDFSRYRGPDEREPGPGWDS